MSSRAFKLPRSLLCMLMLMLMLRTDHQTVRAPEGDHTANLSVVIRAHAHIRANIGDKQLCGET